MENLYQFCVLFVASSALIAPVGSLSVGGVGPGVGEKEVLSVQQLNSCAAQIGDYGVVNLQPLDGFVNGKGRPRFQTTYKDKEYGDVYNYTYNPCSSFSEPADPYLKNSFGGQCWHVALCKFKVETMRITRHYHYPYAIHSSANFSAYLSTSKEEPKGFRENMADTPEIVLSYNGAREVAMKKTHVVLKCNKTLTAPEQAKFIIREDVERFGIVAELHHICCCPGECWEKPDKDESADEEKDLSLLIIVFVNLGLLLLAGAVGLLCFLKSRHISFYSKLPGVPAPATIQYSIAGMMGSRDQPFKDYEPESSRPKKKYLIPVLDDCIIPKHELEIKQRLGGGYFGDTHVGLWLGRKIASSRITVNIHSNQLCEEVLRYIQKEVSFLSKQRHRNIVSMIGVCVEKELPHIISEFIVGETLKNLITNADGAISWSQRIRYCCQAADGMAYLHSTTPPILHRDLRCANIFVTLNETVKVGDFGLVKLIQPLRQKCTKTDCACHQALSACPMSIRWTAPEVLKSPTSLEDEEDSPITTKADVFSFGMMMLELVTSEDPYEEISSEAEVMEKIVAGITPTIPLVTLPQYKILIEQCWSARVSERPKFKQIAIRLKELVPQAKSFQRALDSQTKVKRVKKESESSTLTQVVAVS